MYEIAIHFWLLSFSLELDGLWKNTQAPLRWEQTSGISKQQFRFYKLQWGILQGKKHFTFKQKKAL